MKRHTVDGAEILRGTPDIPPLAPVVAFEHHLRIDGTGYPDGITAAVAESRDDALRHRRRVRRHALAAQVSAGLLRPSGSWRCCSGTTARSSISISSAASCSCSASIRWAISSGSTPAKSRSCCRCTHPTRIGPKVRVLFAADGARLELPRDVNLWEAETAARRSPAHFGHRSAEPRRLRNRSALFHLIADILRARELFAVGLTPFSQERDMSGFDKLVPCAAVAATLVAGSSRLTGQAPSRRSTADRSRSPAQRTRSPTRSLASTRC